MKATRSAAWLVAGALLAAACAPIAYSPKAVDTDPEAEVRRHEARAPADETLAALVASSGYADAWPPAVWRLRDLTLLALHFNPSMRTARAASTVARTELVSAGQRPPLAVSVAAENHSRQQDGDGPWSLGLALQLPWVAAEKREARVERASLLADSAELEVAQTAWQVRAQVRDRLVDLWEARARESVLEQRMSARKDMLGLVSRRVEAGLMSARDLAQERALLGELEVEVAASRAFAREATAGLAAALGLPLSTVGAMQIGDQPEVDGLEPLHRQDALVLALRNRLDVQRGLLLYGVADAELKLAVAAQYPEISLSPGYLWDQGDNVWSLATSLGFPPGLSGKAAVREAQARRELAAQRFEEVQTNTISDVESALDALLVAVERIVAASLRFESAQAQFARTVRLFDAGVADRMQVTAARVTLLAAGAERHTAGIAKLRAVTALEDALQHPLIGEFPDLPASSEMSAEWNR
jgi:outer membrane protein, heavy metal efflux system